MIGDYHRDRSTQPESSFPTEEAERAKAQKKAGHIAVKRKKVMEIHHDDCGENLDSLGPDMSEAENHTQSLFEHGVFKFLSRFQQKFNHRSGILENDGSSQMSMFLAQVATWPDDSCVDVVEIFGGSGHTSSIRRHCCRTGENFEATAGYERLNSRDVASLWIYFKNSRPYIVIMAPPCGGFGPWVRLNRIIYPTAVNETLAVGLQLAELCAAIARFQLKNHRHFIVEQPLGSEMFRLKSWETVLKSAHRVTVDQCQFCLKHHKPPHLPLMKPTELWSSRETILRYLHGHRCSGRHDHGKVTHEAQIWHYQLCSNIARGIAEALIEDSQLVFVQYSCPGCRGHDHVGRHDARHTRDENCKRPDKRPCHSSSRRTDWETSSRPYAYSGTISGRPRKEGR